MITVKECKYCDGTTKCWPYGKDESVHCSNCGAEWDPVEVEYSDNYFDDEDFYDEDLYDDQYDNERVTCCAEGEPIKIEYSDDDFDDLD